MSDTSDPGGDALEDHANVPGDQQGGGEQRDRAEEAMQDSAAERGGRSRERGHNKINRLLQDRYADRSRIADLEAKLAAAEAKRLGDSSTALEAEMGRVERDVAQSHQDGDAEAIARNNRRMAETAANRTAMAFQAQAAQQAAAQAEARRATVATEAPAPNLSPTTQEWVDQNSWWNQDQSMTRQARVLDEDARDLRIQVDTPEYWKYIEEGMEQRFPGKVTRIHSAPAQPGQRDAPQQRAPSGAAPPGRVPAGRQPAPRSITLSPAEREAAKITGISEQQYAANLMKRVASGQMTRVNVGG